jgi:hypothetical protein
MFRRLLSVCALSLSVFQLSATHSTRDHESSAPAAVLVLCRMLLYVCVCVFSFDA